jgi:hypothetical protein
VLLKVLLHHLKVLFFISRACEHTMERKVNDILAATAKGVAQCRFVRGVPLPLVMHPWHFVKAGLGWR